MITDKDKLVCESQGAEAGGKGNLRSFVDDAVVELASREQSTNIRCVRCTQEPTKFNPALTGQSRGTS